MKWLKTIGKQLFTPFKTIGKMIHHGAKTIGKAIGIAKPEPLKLTPEEQVYAEFTQQSYEGNPYASLYNYNLDQSLSSQKNLVYKHKTDPNKIIMSIRGTKPNDIEDLSSDVSLFFNHKFMDDRYVSSLKHYDRVRQNNPNANIKLVGHSLGGNVAKYIIDKNPNDNKVTATTFNMGMAPIERVIDMFKKPDQRIQNLKIQGDPASLLVSGKTLEGHGNMLERHKLDNFLHGAVM